MTNGSGGVGEGFSSSSFAPRSRGDESNGLDSEGGQSLERIVLLKFGERSGLSHGKGEGVLVRTEDAHVHDLLDFDG